MCWIVILIRPQLEQKSMGKNVHVMCLVTQRQASANSAKCYTAREIDAPQPRVEEPWVWDPVCVCVCVILKVWGWEMVATHLINVLLQKD